MRMDCWKVILLMCMFCNLTGTWDTQKKSYAKAAHNDCQEEGCSGKHSSSTDTTTDDEDASGEGSGSIETENRYRTQAPTTRKMTQCEQLRSLLHGLKSGTNYIPQCTSTGEFEIQQCEGNTGSKKCWCVNPYGVEIPGTQMPEPHMRDCHNGTVYDAEETTTINVNIKAGTFNKTEEDKNPKDKSVKPPNKQEARSTFLKMIESPEILAAVIGGSVVGLLFAISLVMFIVYRMRKKDEGSSLSGDHEYTKCSYMKTRDGIHKVFLYENP